MADISKLSRLVNGVQRNVDLSTNTIVAGSIKIGVGQTELTQAILDKLILIQSAADVDGTFDTRYTKIADLSSSATGKGASLVGIEDAASNFAGTTVEDALAELYAGLGSGSADGITYSNATSGLTATDVQAAIDEVEARVDATEIVANAAIPATEKGAALGVATLDAGGKIPVAQLPNAVMTYEGVWDASTNTPTLADGVGNAGMVYRVTNAGSVDFGSGSISFVSGDYTIYSGSVWEKSDGSDAVSSVNGFTGVVVLDTDDISEGSTNLYFTSARAKTATVADAITDGVTDVAPSQNAVFDALALKQDASAELAEAETFFAATDISGAEAETLTDGSNADALHSHAAIKRSMIAGESFAASLFAVRLAKAADAGFAAGRVYKADIDASSVDNFHVTGLVNSAASAAGAIVVTKMGPMTVTAHGFTVGQPLYLSASGAITATPPSTSNMAVVKIGMAEDANTIDVQIQIMGVN